MDSSHDLLGPLTANQREAVECVDGPLLILAGPGSGKTRVITHRIAFLLRQGVPAKNILALTFTNKAADEMRARLEQLAPTQPVWLGTFHRFCARLLRQYAPLVGLQENFSIYDTQDSGQLIKEAIKLAGVQLSGTSPDQVASAISWAKNEVIPADQYCARPGSTIGWLVERVYPVYQRRLLESCAVDFDDLLLHIANLLRDSEELRSELDGRFQYILVDEYQDTNLAQYTIARGLSRDYPNLAVAGDPDQSIYGWRGANLNNILDFEHDFRNVKVVRLEQNYRSTPNILRLADQLIANNVRRKQKALYTDRPEGTPVRLVVHATGCDEADEIAFRIAEEVASGGRRLREFAIFYRINAMSRLLENALRRCNVAYQIVKGLEFYQRKEIKDVLAYLRLLNNPSDDLALQRIINTPPRKIGQTTIRRLAEYAAERGISLLTAACQVEQIQTIKKQSAGAVKRFTDMFQRLQSIAVGRVEDIVRQLLIESGYHEWLEQSEVPEDQDRLENIGELVADAREFDDQYHGDAGLEAYLEQRSLVNDTDDWDEKSDRVTLMTLHAAKGLEFPTVFIIGVEQGILPYRRRGDESDDQEEERRLLFVGITRAQHELTLSHAQYRSVQGERRAAVPSPFLMELPREEMQLTIPEPRQVPRDESRQHTEDRLWDDDDYLHHDPDQVAFDSIKLCVSPRRFKQGMAVEHPDYGAGKIVSINGTGRNCTAIVHFFSDGEERTFRLSHVNLLPVDIT